MFREVSRHLPPLSVMLEDLGNPSTKEIARSFHVHVRTVQRWIKVDRAPRAVALAIFLRTRWGRSEVETHAINGEAIHRRLADAWKHEAQVLERELARVLANADFGSANRPTFREFRSLPVHVVRPRLQGHVGLADAAEAFHDQLDDEAREHVRQHVASE